MFSTTVKLKKTTWNRVKKCSAAAGYASPDEFVEHILDKELSKVEDAESDAAIVKKLQGLGYLD
jgi:hypothetical protein